MGSWEKNQNFAICWDELKNLGVDKEMSYEDARLLLNQQETK